MTAKDGWRDAARGLVFDNLGLKIVSLLCSLAFYAFIQTAEDAARPVAVPVVVVPPPPAAKRVLLTPLPTEVAVTVRGPRTQLDDLRGEDLGSVEMDLETGRETRIDFEPSMFHVPNGLKIETIHPRSITLRWDDIVSRTIPVQIARTGEPAPGFVVKTTTAVNPSSVAASGPRSVVELIQSVRAVPFDVSGLGEGVYNRQLALEKPPELVAYERAEATPGRPDEHEHVESVVAQVEIAREQQRKVFQKVKVEVIGLLGAKTQPALVDVYIEGTPEQIGALLPEGIIPRVEPKSAPGADTSRPGSAYLDVLVDVPRIGDSQPAVHVTPPKVVVKW